MSDLELEPASFRDPASTVAYLDGRVLRVWTKEGAADFDTSPPPCSLPRPWTTASWSGPRRSPWRTCPRASGATLWCGRWEHERIPFVSYPYEWTFSMLRDAALVHPDLLLAALDADLTMKDGYAYNLAATGAPGRPSSTSARSSGSGPASRAGYRQFCQTMLYPLLLQAHKDVRFLLAARRRPGHPAPGPGQAVLRHRQDEAGRAQARLAPRRHGLSAYPSPEPRTPRRS